MKVYIKNKIISWGGGSTVLDENKNEIYKVKGKVFSQKRVFCGTECLFSCQKRVIRYFKIITEFKLKGT